MVEFALVLPVLLVVLLFAVDFGRAFYSWVILQNAARIGANFAALNPEGWESGGDAGLQAQYVAQQLGLNGIGFEGTGLSTTVPGNGADSLFVNTATYGDMAAYLSSDLPGRIHRNGSPESVLNSNA